jgi:hypothetical protein
LATGEWESYKKVENAEEAKAVSDKKVGKTIVMPIVVPGLGSLYTLFT